MKSRLQVNIAYTGLTRFGRRGQEISVKSWFIAVHLLRLLYFDLQPCNNSSMPNNKRHTIKQLQGKGKDKVHPGSRKAGQLDRISLRADKLSHEGRMRKTASVSRSTCSAAPRSYY